MIVEKGTLKAFEALYYKCKEDGTEFMLFMLLSYDLRDKGLSLVKVFSLLAWFSVDGPYTEACTQNKDLCVELILCKDYFREVMLNEDDEYREIFITLHNSFVLDYKNDKSVWFVKEIKRAYKL
jgi:hypothetical protein